VDPATQPHFAEAVLGLCQTMGAGCSGALPLSFAFRAMDSGVALLGAGSEEQAPVEAFVRAAAKGAESIEWVTDTRLGDKLHPFEFETRFDWMKWLDKKVLTMKAKICLGLTVPLCMMFLLVRHMHYRSKADKGAILMLNVFQHWIKAIPVLKVVTARERQHKLRNEKKVRADETVKERRERLRREEEEDADDDYEAPEDVQLVFDLFDHDEDGTISKGDLSLVARRIGSMDDTQLFSEMIASLDVDSKGEVSIKEFQVMTRTIAPEPESSESGSDDGY